MPFGFRQFFDVFHCKREATKLIQIFFYYQNLTFILFIKSFQKINEILNYLFESKIPKINLEIKIKLRIKIK